ncbi:glycosyl transferase [Virgisporangium aliadipatigenens]|uniref:Glycosyl transferase n=1 Tax=Virgisporangium aliadipatigenens TaxID=741659 RepID=A0A8J4DVM8_9ACTN|nr:hypothetical protein [Virgisporangium aliadipatigenens]GIJ51984.1 glycosyl transferase [Virgisporangium aliadipatigenens]
MSSSLTTLDAPPPEPAPSSEPERPEPRPNRLADAFALALYVVMAFIVTAPLWRGDGVLKENRDDPIFFQWMFVHASRIFTHGENPFFAEQMNAPFGLNLMANTSVLGLAIPLTPVTLLFGPWISFLIMTTAGLAGTAFAWYFVLSRHLTTQRAAAIIGGVFCGFAPGMISQAIGHPNIISQFLVPFMVLAVIRLRRAPERWLRTGLTLAGLVVYQAFINLEVLFLAALVLIVFALFYLVQRLRGARVMVTGAFKAAGVCAAVAGALLAFPVAWQFFGPSAYHGLPDGVQEFGTDLLAASAFSRESIIGSPETSYGLASSGAEENTFFGSPVLLALLGAAIVLLRTAGGRALVATLLLFWGFSLGPHIRINGELTDIPGPWYPISQLPLFDSVVPTRLGLALIPMVGLVLALGIDRFRPDRFRPAVIALVVAALLPSGPTPLTVSGPHVPPTPAFFTSGNWRQHVPDNGVVMTLPPGWVSYLGAMQWQIDTRLDFDMVGGYYLAPTPGDPSKRANFGPAYPPTMRLLWYVGEGGGEVYVSDEHRRLARTDLKDYHVTTLILPAAHPRAAQVKSCATQLFGQPQRVDDVWLWDVRSFVAGG